MSSDPDFALAEEAWMSVRAVPPGRRQQGLGCVVAFLGMATLTLTPAIGNYVEFSAETAYLVLAAAVGLLFAGAALGLTGSRRAGIAGRNQIDEAVERVVTAHETGDRSLPAHAVELIVVLREAGPGVTGEVAPRLGEAFDYVQRIDAHFRGRPVGVPPGGVSSP